MPPKDDLVCNDLVQMTPSDPLSNAANTFTGYLSNAAKSSTGYLSNAAKNLL